MFTFTSTLRYRVDYSYQCDCWYLNENSRVAGTLGFRYSQSMIDMALDSYVSYKNNFLIIPYHLTAWSPHLQKACGEANMSLLFQRVEFGYNYTALSKEPYHFKSRFKENDRSIYFWPSKIVYACCKPHHLPRTLLYSICHPFYKIISMSRFWSYWIPFSITQPFT